jgi:hypothetical protein
MTIKVEGAGFNIDYWSQHSEADFVAECKQSGYFAQYEQQEELLKLVFKLMHEHISATSEPAKV